LYVEPKILGFADDLEDEAFLSFNTYHHYENTFKPTSAEVYAQLPKGNLEKIAAFEIWTYLSEKPKYYVANINLYKKI